MPQNRFYKIDQKHRKQQVGNWIKEHGRVCAGWMCDPHDVAADTPVHWDHIIPLSKGGNEYGPGQLLCKVCNEAKHNTDLRDFDVMTKANPTHNPLADLEFL